MESTYNWYWLVDGLQDQGFTVHLVNTAAVKQYDELKHSGDSSDARHLAHLLRLGILPVGHIYPCEQRAARDVLRKRGCSAAVALGCRGTSWDLPNLLCRIVNKLAFKSTSASVSAGASEIRIPVQASRPNSVCITAARGLDRDPRAVGSLQQCDQFHVAVDGRCQAAGDRPEDRLVGHLGGRLELLQPARERPQPAQATRPSGSRSRTLLGRAC